MLQQLKKKLIHLGLSPCKIKTIEFGHYAFVTFRYARLCDSTNVTSMLKVYKQNFLSQKIGQILTFQGGWGSGGLKFFDFYKGTSLRESTLFELFCVKIG